MSNEILTALIALSGVALSVLISYLTSRRQASIEIMKFRAELLRLYGGQLYEKRIQAYEEIYYCLSNFVKDLKYGNLTKSRLKDFNKEIKGLDSKYSFYFSATTTYIGGKFIKEVMQFENKSDEEFDKHFSSLDNKKELGFKIGQYELALKNELGIYKFDSLVSIEDNAEFWTYEQMDAAVKKAFIKEDEKRKNRMRPA